MRLRQIVHRARRGVPLRVLAAGTHARAPATWRPLAAGLGVDPAPQSVMQETPEASGTFAFVGTTRSFVDTRDFWRAGNQGLLFAFHLNAFAELARYAASSRTDEGDAFWGSVADSWLTHVGEPARPGWHAYPLSGRIIAWCASLSAGGWPADLEQRLLSSLVRQAQVLARSVEHDIGGNHVLRNACALTFAGVCLDDVGLERRGSALLHRELRSQLLSDGGHEERSTAYHRAIRADLDDVAVLLERAHGTAPRWLEQARERMAAWELAMRGPDGKLPMLNDAWEGPARTPVPDREPQTILRESGYVVLRNASDQLIVDAGPVAPRHLPPHAHADVLSFVLWGDGGPLIMDPGAFTYAGPERAAFRGTAAHNTVEVDSLDQCVLWGDFRAGFMPHAPRLQVDSHDDVVVVVARHDGYRRLEDPVEHERWFCWVPNDGLVVVDVLHAARAHRATSRLHLAPGVGLASDDRIGPFALRALGVGPAHTVVQGRYAPHLGEQVAIDVVERSSTMKPGVVSGWSLLRRGAHAALDGRSLTLTRRTGHRVIIELR